ncbi:signal recognition particle protein [Anaerorhabdus furcosa]|uniref:Signal recognition particle protein n=1 Tax=Anaerorhabdus furcosa TaxID=118967 RepID=A0A1T4NF68_9FIRM|nr:signal recognition particle protein [Anaerorhabdus furcosa]SJZ77991.1 signal recognition particle subunit FFH/SRP54 (srp54) [Anaerorhabdus furcosa]
MAFDSLSNRLNKALRDLSGKGRLTEKNMEDMLKEVRIALLEADVNYKIVKDFLVRVKEKSLGTDVLEAVDPSSMVVKIVHDEIVELLGTQEATLNYAEDGMTVIMMVGLQGTGKTTSIAKVANLVKKKHNRNPLLVAADIIRPAAIEQLQTLGKSIDVEVFTKGIETPATETVKQAMLYAKEKGYDTVFIDTAGRLHIDEELMNELKEIENLVHPNDILLTVDAMTGQDIVQVAKSFHEQLNVTGLVVTKFDGDSRGGGVLSVRSITQVPVKFVGQGEKIDDLELFYPDRMADRILGMGDIVTLVEQAQEKMDLEESERAAKRMMEGTFTMEDMLSQLEQVSKMGPIGGILKMLPGMNQYADMINDADAEKGLKKQKAIIQSMTLEEREDPSILNNRRKNRIAKGSGSTPQEVSKMVSQFEKMQKMMKQMGALSKGGKLPNLGGMFGKK